MLDINDFEINDKVIILNKDKVIVKYIRRNEYGYPDLILCQWPNKMNDWIIPEYITDIEKKK